MKKEEQKNINILTLAIIEDVNDELDKAYASGKTFKRLRSCTAYTIETENFIVLKSYSTIIAVKDKRTNTFFDFLRYVYGYTSTSAQHFAKFRNMFRNTWNDTTYTYRTI